jgi:hypothetical protein
MQMAVSLLRYTASLGLLSGNYSKIYFSYVCETHFILSIRKAERGGRSGSKYLNTIYVEVNTIFEKVYVEVGTRRATANLARCY